MEAYVVESLIEYIELLEKIGRIGTEKWYRGQSKWEYRFSPSALRNVYAIEDSRGYKLDSPLLDNTCSGSDNVVVFFQ